MYKIFTVEHLIAYTRKKKNIKNRMILLFLKTDKTVFRYLNVYYK